MAQYRGIQSVIDDSLILHLDTMNPKTYRGKHSNLAGNMIKSYSNWGTNTGYSSYFTAPNRTQGVYCNCDSYTSGGFRYDTSIVDGIQPQYEYTYSIIFKSDKTPSVNMLYIYFRDINNGYLSENGYFNTYRMLSMGNNWYMAWGNPIAPINCTRMELCQFDYQTINIWIYDLRLEQRGNILNDLTKNNRYATIYNASFTNTNGLEHLVFDGVDDKVVIAHDLVFNSLPITISGWVNLGSGSRFEMFNKYVSNSVNGYRIWITNSGVHFYYFRNGSNYIGSNYDSPLPITINSNTWYHITVSFDYTGAYAYVNGNYIGTKSWVGTPAPTVSTDVISIGQYQGSSYTAGKLSELKVYNRMLSIEEVGILFNSIKKRYGY